MLNERTYVTAFAASQQPKPILPRGEWTNHTDNRLGSHHADGCKVRHAKPKTPHERPATPVPQPDHHQAPHHERHEPDVNHEEQVSQQQVNSL